MKTAIRNLIFLSVFLFSISYDSLITGVNYDRKHKLYPKRDYCDNCCVISLSPSYVYGKRWERIGVTAFFAGTVLSLTAFLIWRGKRENKTNLSILIRE